MERRRNNADHASKILQIALSTGLISISALLVAIAAPTITKKAPRDADLESAIVVILPAGPYTAILAGKDGGVGVALVEAYAL